MTLEVSLPPHLTFLRPVRAAREEAELEPTPREAALVQALRDRPDLSYETAVFVFEHWLLTETLREHRGRVNAAARALALPRRVLTEKLARHGLDCMEFRGSRRRSRAGNS